MSQLVHCLLHAFQNTCTTSYGTWVQAQQQGQGEQTHSQTYLENTPNSFWWCALAVHDLDRSNTTIGSNCFPKGCSTKASSQLAQIMLILQTQQSATIKLRAHQAGTHICQSAKPVSISLLELVYLTVPAQHLKCLIERCSPPVTCEPGWVLGSSRNKFYPRAPISTSERFHNVLRDVIPATQQARHKHSREGGKCVTCS